jgi:hypothetical protein
MLASDIAKRLLVFTDNRTLSEANTAGTEYLETAVDAINAAAQQIYLLGPSTVSVRDFGLVTQPATAVTVTGTALTTSATLGGSATWMAGNAFQLSDDTYNRILELNGNVATIQNPLKTTQLASTATVWNDALALSLGIVEVLYGVTLDDTINLRPAGGEMALYHDSTIYGPVDYGRTFPSRVTASPPVPGQPRAYYVAPINPQGNSAQSPTFMRLSPYPTIAHTLRFRARVGPPKITVADLDAANNGTACTKQIPIPAGWDELFLLPIAKQIFTGSPFFNNSAQKEEIGRAYKDALGNLDRMRGQASRPLNFVPTV